MTFTLSPEQSESLEALSNFEGIYTLKGYAGTGKTTVITHWVKKMREKPDDADKYWRPPSIVLTAPTNKATNVLKEMAKEINLPVDVSTIHSLLSLKVKWEKDEQVLVKDNYGEDTFNEYDYIVIDECSMLDETLMDHIGAAMHSAENSIVFMGDPCQLPPISESESRSFVAGDSISELTQVMRQKKDNPIQKMALYLREMILNNVKTYPTKIFEFVDDKHIFHFPSGNFMDDILDNFEIAEDEGRDIRHVAWRNRVVDVYNGHIRDRLYGPMRPEWVQGEAIVTLQPVIDRYEERVIFSTDTLLEIQRPPEEVTHEEIPCWLLWARNRKLYVPTEAGEKAFGIKKQLLLKEAKADRKKWWKFYRFMESFARVRPAHSLTVHRSQGSTFDDVYVSYADILSNPNRKESLQCLYVAITRPKERLILV